MKNIYLFFAVLGFCIISNNLKAQSEKKILNAPVKNKITVSMSHDDSLKVNSENVNCRKKSFNNNSATNKNASSQPTGNTEEQNRYAKKIPLIKVEKEKSEKKDTINK